MIYVGILILFLFIGILFMMGLELKKYAWVYRFLLKPLKKFKDSYTLPPHSNTSIFELSDELFVINKYYDLKFNKKSLENLAFEIGYRANNTENKSFINYLTAGILPTISFIFAGVALVSEKVPMDDAMTLFFVLTIFIFMILLIMVIDYFTQSKINARLEKHLCVIKEVLKTKQNETSQNRRRRGHRLN